MKLFLALMSAAVAVQAYPIFKQCDPLWAKDQLGTSLTNTICSAGCLMSSVSMILNDCGRKINDQDITPKNLNSWLRRYGGYVDGDNLVWGSIKPYGYSF